MFPITFLILMVTSLEDAPYMPCLGLPIFYFASLRPYRNSIHISKYIEDSSEGSIYNSYLSKAYSKLLCSQPLWSHYLVRIGKYFGIMQVLEYQEGYAIIQFKGLESQETTSCHGIEAAEVDRIVNAQDCISFFGSAITLQSQFQVSCYEENQQSLTGEIEAAEFVSGFKKIYLKMLCYYVKQELTQSNQNSIIELSKKRFEGYENQFPNEFADLIELKKLLISFNQDVIDQQTEIKIQTKPQPKVQINHKDVDIMGMLDDFTQEIPQQIKKLQQQKVKSGSIYNHIQRSILYLYQVSLGDLDFNQESKINQKLLFNLFQSSKSLSEQRQMKGIDLILSDIANKAVRIALKMVLIITLLKVI